MGDEHVKTVIACSLRILTFPATFKGTKTCKEETSWFWSLYILCSSCVPSQCVHREVAPVFRSRRPVAGNIVPGVSKNMNGTFTDACAELDREL